MMVFVPALSSYCGITPILLIWKQSSVIIPPHSVRVSVSIYDVDGRLVKNLISNEMLSQGYHEVYRNGRDQQGNVTPSGVYLCVLKSKGNVKAVKLLAIK